MPRLICGRGLVFTEDCIFNNWHICMHDIRGSRALPATTFVIGGNCRIFVAEGSLMS